MKVSASEPVKTVKTARLLWLWRRFVKSREGVEILTLPERVCGYFVSHNPSNNYSHNYSTYCFAANLLLLNLNLVRSVILVF